jgi:hypothetical protein
MFCRELMQERPEGLDASPSAPHPLYVMVRDMALGKVEILRTTGIERIRSTSRSSNRFILDFHGNAARSSKSDG